MIFLILFFLSFLLFIFLRTARGKKLQNDTGLHRLEDLVFVSLFTTGLTLSFKNIYLFEDIILGGTWGAILDSGKFVLLMAVICYFLQKQTEELNGLFFKTIAISLLLSVAATISATPFLSSIILIVAMFTLKVKRSKLFLLHLFPFCVFTSQIFDYAVKGDFFYLNSTADSVLKLDIFIITMLLLAFLVTINELVNQARDNNKQALFYLVPFVVLFQVINENFSNIEINSLIRTFFFCLYALLIVWRALKPVDRLSLGNIFEKLIVLTVLLSLFTDFPRDLFPLVGMMFVNVIILLSIKRKEISGQFFDYISQFLAFLFLAAFAPWIMYETLFIQMSEDIKIHLVLSYTAYYLAVTFYLLRLISNFSIPYKREDVFDFNDAKRYVQSIVFGLLNILMLVIFLKNHGVRGTGFMFVSFLLVVSTVLFALATLQPEKIIIVVGRLRTPDLGFKLVPDEILKKVKVFILAIYDIVIILTAGAAALISDIISFASFVSFELLNVIIKQKMSIAILVWVVLFALMSKRMIA